MLNVCPIGDVTYSLLTRFKCVVVVFKSLVCVCVVVGGGGRGGRVVVKSRVCSLRVTIVFL